LAANPGTGTSTTSSTMPPQVASTAFQALISQHGGVAATTAYCKGVAHPGKPPSTASPSASGTAFGKENKSDGVKPSTAGKPANAGRPAGAGKPSGAGSSAGHAPVPSPNSGGSGTADTASGGASLAGTATANTASGGASSAGSGNATSPGR
jgi:hypothetical protein